MHIGTEKTATTLIQNWLYDNYNQLSKQGVALTKVSDIPNNRKLVAYFQDAIDEYLQNKQISEDESRTAFFDGYETEFAREIERLKKHHTDIVFTSEHFHSRLVDEAQIKSLKAFLDQFFDEFKVVCYFREQSKVRTSLYSTGLKIRSTQKIQDFQSDVDTNSHYYNYALFFGKWEAAFGPEALSPRLFLKEHLVQGDIRHDFLVSALPGVDADKLDFKINSSNESLSADTATLFRKVNVAKPYMVGGYLDPTPIALKAAVNRTKPLDQKSPVYDPRQNDMYDAFNEANIDFFDKYFGEKRNLFPRPRKLKENDDDRKRFDLSDVSQLLNAVMSIKNLLVVNDQEVDLLRDLAVQLHASGAITNKDATTLLKIASRARPKGPAILAKLDELRKQK